MAEQVFFLRRVLLVLALTFLIGGTLACEDVSAQSAQLDPRPVGLELIAQGMTAPVQVVPEPDAEGKPGRLFVVDQAGQVWVIDSDGDLLQDPFLDVSGRLVEFQAGFDERGLLGLAFHPEYRRNGRFFVYYSAPLREGAPEDFDHTSHLSEFTVSEQDPNRADPDSEHIILQVDEPQFNHDGSTVRFGPEDGYLYVSLGDGGASDDAAPGHVEDWYDFNDGGNGQDVTQNLLGSILRIDVDAGDPYGVPDDNPFVGRAGLDEIYAYGLRNPYRMSFDRTGEFGLLAIDAGQELWEEISIIENGGNYGWNVKEGTHCFNGANPDEPAEQCPDTVGPGHPDQGAPLIDPVVEFPNSKQPGGLGVTVSDAFMYRGKAITDLQGQLVFSVWSESRSDPQGRLFYAVPSETGLWSMGELVPERPGDPEDGSLGHFILGMGQDDQGELYITTSNEGAPVGETGRVYRLTSPEEQ